ncbi:hypothetical protein TL13_1619 [Streptococcus suis TL13]|nr:hypothetical protein TL13_1619 [Streptococcus suis TL13]
MYFLEVSQYKHIKIRSEEISDGKTFTTNLIASNYNKKTAL